jgi:hypothetical protein
MQVGSIVMYVTSCDKNIHGEIHFIEVIPSEEEIEEIKERVEEYSPCTDIISLQPLF